MKSKGALYKWPETHGLTGGYVTPIYGVMGPYLQLLGARFVHSVFFCSVPVDILGSMLQDLIVYCFRTIVFCIYACFFNSMMWWHCIALLDAYVCKLLTYSMIDLFSLSIFLLFVSVVKSCGQKQRHVHRSPRFVEDRTDKIGLLLGRKKPRVVSDFFQKKHFRYFHPKKISNCKDQCNTIWKFDT